MTVSESVAAYIAERRELLSRLEQFVETSEYRSLLAAVVPLAGEDPEPWLADWLIEPVVSLGRGDRPIDVVAQPGGVDRVKQHIRWLATFVVN